MRFIRVRTLLLKNAGPKLAHIEKQPHTAHSISTGADRAPHGALVMSLVFHRDDNERVGTSDTRNRMSLSQSRTDRSGETKDDRADRPQGNCSARSEQQPLTHEREQTRRGRNRLEWSPTGQAVIREVGRFRTLDEQDVERVFYSSNPKQFQADLDHLSKQGLLLRRSVSAGKNGEIRRVVVLSKRAERLAQHHRLTPEGQAALCRVRQARRGLARRLHLPDV